MTIAIAIYGACVATGALLWQVFSWRKAHATRILVDVFADVASTGGMATHPVVKVDVRNLSGHEVRIIGVGLTQEGSREVVHVPPTEFVPLGGVPGVLPARDVKSAWLARTSAEEAGLDLSQPIIGWVALATGERFRSKPTVV